MSSTSWTFALAADGSFVPVPLARLHRFLEGADTMPGIEGVVYVADVHVELQSRKATSASIYGFFKYKVGSNGRWDAAHKQDADLAWRGLIASIGSEGHVGQGDGLIGGDRFAKRRVDVQHRWKPTRQQLARVGEAITKRAKRAIPIRLFPNDPNRELT